jgi:transcriptional regulator with XRE-family HTH domain
MKELTNEQAEYAVSCFVSIYQSREIKQVELERMSGVDQSTISKIVHSRDGGEKYAPSTEVLEKLFQAMGIKLADIIYESDHLTEEIVGYLATPLTCLSAREDQEVRRVVEKIRKIAAESEFTNPPFKVYWPGDHTHPTQHSDIPAAQVYVTDRSRASTHDFIVLFCAAPSYGVGQENEIATQAGVPAIRLVPPTGLSRMMLGSFAHAIDIPYSGDLKTRVVIDDEKLRAALREIKSSFFQSHALYRKMNGEGFGRRLRKLIDDRCNGGYNQFAKDIGVSLRYLHKMMDEPFIISNPSALLLRRIAHRLGERAAFLLGEQQESDPIWVESNASWQSWIDKTPSLDARVVLQLRRDWRNEYAIEKRDQQASIASFRKSTRAMRETDWDKRYQSFQESNAKSQKQPTLI